MFTLPQGGLTTEGQSDEKPIILAGDTPDEFRHFLWALYALLVRLLNLTTESNMINKNLDHQNLRTSFLQMLTLYILSI